ncbi:hypothetical protein GLA29479_2031 [Lysobacter antibioticus]|uniref:Uncharacterized protein n=1 Tax=Lysobacter antibioticus TaxID=84531 RepID=A0A0S2F6Z1_LYSAN|nr:hypothetical protein GLA29479_2031 [Lysobacter antibioticus]ALN79333.1 hypothetical protein LA76x_1174 [Lysobacter antibioticus]
MNAVNRERGIGNRRASVVRSPSVQSCFLIRICNRGRSCLNRFPIPHSPFPARVKA